MGSDDKARICVARVGAPHGVRGDVRLWSFTADPLAVADYGPLESEDGARRLAIAALRPQGECLVAHFAGVDDRTAAEGLRNLDLYVPRERLPEAGDGEFYYADLVGLRAVDASGETLGEVVAVHNFGAGDVIELRLRGQRDTVMVPFTEETAPEVDVAGGRIVVILPNDVEADPMPLSPIGREVDSR